MTNDFSRPRLTILAELAAILALVVGVAGVAVTYAAFQQDKAALEHGRTKSPGTVEPTATATTSRYPASLVPTSPSSAPTSAHSLPSAPPPSSKEKSYFGEFAPWGVLVIVGSGLLGYFLKQRGILSNFRPR